LCKIYEGIRPALNDEPERHSRDRPNTSHNNENSVTVENLIREDRRVSIREEVVQYFTFLATERIGKGVSNL
jgi:hypothetical protein